jgi:hypothetical protein
VLADAPYDVVNVIAVALSRKRIVGDGVVGIAKRAGERVIVGLIAAVMVVDESILGFTAG